jgi:hypothetical protein
MFTADSYSIGGSAGSGSISGIADTGTTLLLLDDSIVSAYYSKVAGSENNQLQGGYTFPCAATLPDFSISVAGETRTGKIISAGGSQLLIAYSSRILHELCCSFRQHLLWWNSIQQRYWFLHFW